MRKGQVEREYECVKCGYTEDGIEWRVERKYGDRWAWVCVKNGELRMMLIHVRVVSQKSGSPNF